MRVKSKKMKMKNLFFLLLAVALAFVSCSKDNAENNEVNPTLVGTWEIVSIKSIKTESGKTPFTEVGELKDKQTITFKADGTGHLKTGQEEKAITYKVNDNKLTVVYADDKVHDVTFSVTAEKLFITQVIMDRTTKHETITESKRIK